MEKEKRGANFTKAESDLLIDVCLKYKQVIENKKTDATTWKDKNLAWCQISQEFNATSGNFPRSVKTIRSKYETIKKNIRKKCSMLKNLQNKTGGGQCPENLTPYEEKILALSPNTMVGLSARYDDDDVQYGEPGPSGIKQTNYDVGKEPQCDAPIEIDYVNEEDYDVLQYLKETENLELEATLTNTDKLDGTQKGSMKRKNDARDFDNEKGTHRGTDAKFIFKNKRTKKSKNADTMQEIVILKNQLLKMQMDLLQQELEISKGKAEITKLTIENLKLEGEIKKLTLQKLEANIVDDDDYN